MLRSLFLIMRHGNKVNPLGRKAAHRHALMRNLASALIEHKRISTTLAKARELRKYIEPLVTKSKSDSTHNRRVVFSYLQNKDAIKELFDTISQKVADRPGGYVRIIKLGFRKSDGADMALIEFVDFNTVYQSGDAAGKASGAKRRGRRGGKTKTESTAPAAPVQDSAAEENSEVSENND